MLCAPIFGPIKLYEHSAPVIVGAGYGLFIWPTERLYFLTHEGRTTAVMAISEDDAYGQWRDFYERH